MSKKFEDLCEMKSGEVYWESSSLGNIQFVLKDDPTLEDNKIQWVGVCLETGCEIQYLVTKGYEHYGPKIYDYKAYSEV